MKLDSLKIDSVAIENGVWVSDIPGLGNVRLRVRGFGNADYKRRQSQLMQSLSISKRKDPDELDKITATLFHETILLEWEGIDDFEYSKENAKLLLFDPAFRKFQDGVAYAAALVADGQTESLKDDIKN